MKEVEKQALIEHAKSWIADAEAARDDIPFGFDEDTEMELSLIKIALASLTAQPDEWQKRAEAAEAKLADLEKQEPYGYVAESPCSSGYGGSMYEFSIDRRDAEHDANQAEGFVIDLFTRPAPAVSLVELVPEGWRLVPVEPTQEMLHASYREASVYSPSAYRAMLAAAPTPHD